MGEIVTCGVGTAAVMCALAVMLQKYKPGVIAYVPLRLMLFVSAIAPLVSLLANSLASALSVGITVFTFMSQFRYIALHLRVTKVFRSGVADSDAAVVMLDRMTRICRTVTIELNVKDEATVCVTINAREIGSLRLNGSASEMILHLRNACDPLAFNEIAYSTAMTIVSCRHGSKVQIVTE